MDADANLLRSYADAGSEPAFREFVQRNLPLVYSAALRRLGGDSHAAQEAAQAVFTLAARKARSLARHPALAGWLYTTANLVAIRIMRTDIRRLERERRALMDADNGGSPADWDKFRPVIDEALLGLPEKDRVAILLRYFQSASYAEIGARVGLSENAARMRTDRALDSLHGALARRGITSTAAALGLALAANAASAVPGSLATTIASSACAAAAAPASLLFLMTTSSTIKTGVLAAAFAAAAGSLYIQRQTNSELHREIASLQSQLEATSRRASANARSAGQADQAVQGVQGEVSRLLSENDQLRGAGPSPALVSWQQRLTSLRQRIAQDPSQGIPEFDLLSDEDWLDAAKPALETDADFRRAMASLRNLAASKFLKLGQGALNSFSAANNGQFPTDTNQLQPFLDPTASPAMLQRWEVAPSSTVPNVRIGGDLIVTERAAVDDDYDTRHLFAQKGSGGTSWAAVKRAEVLNPVLEAYRGANGGRSPTNMADALPFASTPEQQALLQSMIASQVNATAK